MPISAGDVTLQFLADTTQLDEAFNRVGAAATSKMGPAAAAVKQTSDSVEEMSQRMAVGAQGAVELGEITNLAGEKVRESMYEARGEVGLLGDLFGIHLPRHVRSFVAELPGIGTALSAAFAATAVLFIVEALVKGIEKIKQFSEEGERMAEAWNKVGRAFQEGDEKIQKGIDQQQQKIIGLTQGPVAALAYELTHMGDVGAAAFQLIKKELTEAQNVMEQGAHFWNFLGIAGEDMKKFGDELDQTMLKAAASTQTHKVEMDKFIEEARRDPTGPLAQSINSLLAGVDKTTEKMGTLQKQVASLRKEYEDAPKAGEKLVEGSEKEIEVLGRVKQQLGELIVMQGKRIEADQQQLHVAVAQQDAQNLKRSLDEQLASIDKWKAGIHAAYQAGSLDAAAWQVAEIRAVDASDIAHENYLRKIIGLYQRAGETEKAHASQQELTALQTKNAAKETEALAAAEQKHRQAVSEVMRAIGNMEIANVTKEWNANEKAVEELTKAEIKLTEAQAKLKEAEISRDYKSEQDAIQKLADFGLITEQQKQQRLAALYEREKNDALNALRATLTQEQAAITAAESKIEATRSSPFFSDAQLKDLQKNLAVAKTAYANTMTQFVKDQQRFDSEIHKSDLAFQKFSLNLRSSAEKNRKTMQQMSDELTKNAQQFVLDMGDAFAAVITGQEGMGQAVEKMMAKLVASIASQWAQYFAGMAIADIFFNPAKAAGEIAAAVALETLAGVLGSVGSSGSGGGSGSGGATHPNLNDNSAATQPQAGAVSSRNIPHLAAGGLVTAPTIALVGDSPSGGRGREAILPLDDQQTMRELAAALGSHHQGHSTTVNVNGIISADNLQKVIKKIDRQVQKRQGRLTSGNSFRFTRRG